jgi:hypothetical protein
LQNLSVICCCHQGVAPQLAFTLCGFLGQDMTLVRLAPLKAPRPGFCEALGGTSVGSNLRHKNFRLKNLSLNRLRF